jgi:glucose-1-phosphate adenylyltransferase
LTLHSATASIRASERYSSFPVQVPFPHRAHRDAWSILNPNWASLSPTFPQMRVGEDWYRGTADAVYQNLYHLRQVDADHVVVLSADHVYKMDYSHFVRYHQSKRSDMTISGIEVDISERHGSVSSTPAPIRGHRVRGKAGRAAPHARSSRQGLCFHGGLCLQA